MFYAATHMEIGSAHMATRLGVSRNVRIYAAKRHGMSSDTNLLPATQMQARPVTLLWFLLSGVATIEHEGTRVRASAPCLMAMPEHWIEGANGTRDVRIQTTGSPFTTVHVLHRAPCVGFAQIPLQASQAREISDAHQRLFAAAPEDGPGVLRALLWKLVTFGLVPVSALQDPDPSLYTDPASVRMWESLRKRYTALDFNPSLKAMAADADLSGRHATRIMAQIFNECLMPPGGFREASINLRLALASLLLSKSTLSVHEVSRLAGYLHPETLANAFRHVGLPSPAEVKRSYATEAVSA